LDAVSYSPSIVTMAIYCIVCKIKRLIGRKSWNVYIPPVFSAPAGSDPVGILWKCLMLVKLEWLGYRMVKKLWRYVKPFSSDTGTSETNGRTDRFAISISCISMLMRNKNCPSRRSVGDLLLLVFEFAQALKIVIEELVIGERTCKLSRINVLVCIPKRPWRSCRSQWQSLWVAQQTASAVGPPRPSSIPGGSCVTAFSIKMRQPAMRMRWQIVNISITSSQTSAVRNGTF